MLFNSYAFIFGFLPVVLIGYALLARHGGPAGRPVWWLVVCSTVFYAIWNPVNLAIILPSLIVNFALARLLQRRVAQGPAEDPVTSAILFVGVALNLCFLGYFKYRNFFVDSANQLLGQQWPMLDLLLPLGISFITFQKIAFLVDVRGGTVKQFEARDFLIFVAFFPQLIAGPIVHYREMVPQFQASPRRVEARDLCIGLCLFAMGLFKKAVLADGIAPHATALFAMSERGDALGLVNAWLGGLCFALQVYFDFSGYSDMATGLARLFGIRLPINFDSPLKATSIIDFWNRWHMTLTRFLTAYVYAPLSLRLTRARMVRGQAMVKRAGSRPAAFAVLVALPTMLTMFLSGLWHGAGLTFVLYGLLHGVYLVINHGWRQWRPAWERQRYQRLMAPLGGLLTLLALVFSMALFKSRTVGSALHMMQAMLGLDGVSLPLAVLGRLGSAGAWLQAAGLRGDMTSGGGFVQAVAWSLLLLAIATGLPNSMQLMARFEPALGMKAVAPVRWQVVLNARWAAWFGLLLLGGLMSLNQISEFLYWHF